MRDCPRYSTMCGILAIPDEVVSVHLIECELLEDKDCWVFVFVTLGKAVWNSEG